MARRFVAVVTCASLVAAALAAPMTHVHDDDHATDHHKPQAIHAHFSGHASPDDTDTDNDPNVRSNETEQTRYLQVFVAVAGASIELPAAAVSPFQLVAPEEAAAHRPVQVVHAHDPPLARSLGSRAPPPFLS